VDLSIAPETAQRKRRTLFKARLFYARHCRLDGNGRIRGVAEFLLISWAG